MKYSKGILSVVLPKQPPAGKVIYKTSLIYKDKEYPLAKGKDLIIRFKGDVPASVLLPHIVFIFFAMLVSARAGIECFNKIPKLRIYTYISVVLLLLGGFVFGPIVQKYAFGEYWTGFPFGFDLTDNKTLIALVFWLIALYKTQKQLNTRKWVLIASIVTLVIFLIPHSLFGSELDYKKM